MFNEDGSLVVVFNGEIYNYRELARQLSAAGHTFATRSDTEVLLHGWEQWGRALPGKLRGMFAFVLWDRTTGTLFGARDLFGIKPLYYYRRGELLLFASEIKAFLAHPGFVKRFNEDRLPDYLSSEYLPGDETLFTGVYELLPGHCFTWQAGRLTLGRYGKIRYRIREGRSLEEWAERIDKAFTGSVAAHKVADVEVGCFLSGGVDSALTACKASPATEPSAMLLGGVRGGSLLRAAGRPPGSPGPGRALHRDHRQRRGVLCGQPGYPVVSGRTYAQPGGGAPLFSLQKRPAAGQGGALGGGRR